MHVAFAAAIGYANRSLQAVRCSCCAREAHVKLRPLVRTRVLGAVLYCKTPGCLVLGCDRFWWSITKPAADRADAGSALPHILVIISLFCDLVYTGTGTGTGTGRWQMGTVESSWH